MRRAGCLVVALVAGACAAGPRALPADHPASPTAPAGRLAPAPAALRPGVVTYPDLPKPSAAPPAEHHHHHG